MLDMTWLAMPDNRTARRRPRDADAPGADPSAAPLDGPLADAGLVRRLLGRDEAALSALYDLHAGAVYGTLLKLLGDAAAQEVLQDVFLRLWERPGDFDPARAGVRTYLLVMARSRALDRLRSGRVGVPLYTADGAELPLPDPAPGPAARSEDAQRRVRVRAALGELSAAHRETVERAYLHGQTRGEIAQAMQVPVGTVKSRLSHALSHLRRVLGTEVEAWLE